jgi:hypothetical protein
LAQRRMIEGRWCRRLRRSHCAGCQQHNEKVTESAEHDQLEWFEWRLDCQAERFQ